MFKRKLSTVNLKEEIPLNAKKQCANTAQDEKKADNDIVMTNDMEHYVRKIPKKIHFIWLGKEIPNDYLQEMKKLAAKAAESGFEVCLWTDNPNNYYKTALTNDNKISNLEICDIGDVIKQVKADSFYDDDKAAKFIEIINQEMVGSKNLAAASDLLRYEILRQFGGYYFDTDTEFNYKLLDTKLKSDIAAHGFLFAGTPKETTIEGMDGGNDIIASVPNHEILRNCIDNSLQNYDDFQKYDDVIDLAMNKEPKKTGFLTLLDKKRLHGTKPTSPLAMLSADRQNLTSKCTGPEMLCKTVKAYAKKYMIDPIALMFKQTDKNASLSNYFFKPKLNPGDTYDVAGISVTSKSNRTWVSEKPKYAFDDIGLNL